MFAQLRAVALSILLAGAAGPIGGRAAAQSQEELRERFREECRAQFPQLSGPAHKEERFAKVSACVQGKFAAHTRNVALRAAATPVSSRELKLLEYEAWLVAKNRGPADAKGVIYFVRGYPQPTDLDSFLSAPYIVKTLSENGWDVISAKVPRGNQTRGMENVGQGAAFMRRRAAELKGQGYKRVVLVGHSWAGWGALLAAQTDDFSADALLLSAPATYGAQVGPKGGANPIYGMNLSEFPGAINKVKTPTVLILPDEREFDPDPVKRGAIAEKHFGQANVAHLVLTKPPGFSGHFAAWLPVFDYAYGRCIEAFIERLTSAPCNPPALSNSDFRSIVGLNQVTNAESRSIASAEPLVGKKFVAYTLSTKVVHHYEYVSATQRKHMRGTGVASESVAFRNDLHCVGSQCTKLLKWSDGQLLEFDAKGGQLVGWWLERR